MSDSYLHLFKYNQFSNLRIIERANQLTKDQLFQERNIVGDSLFGLLFHTMQAEWLLRQFIQHGNIPEKWLNLDDYSNPDELWKYWLEDSTEMIGFLQSGLDFDKTLSGNGPDGKFYEYDAWKLLMQVLFHSMQHRSEAAVILTDLGFSPGNMDLILYQDS